MELFGGLEAVAERSWMRDVSFFLRKTKLAWMSAYLCQLKNQQSDIRFPPPYSQFRSSGIIVRLGINLIVVAAV